MTKKIKKFRDYLINLIEIPDKDGHLQGEYVCHTDIPEKIPDGFDASFTVCGEDENYVYTILIKKIEI